MPGGAADKLGSLAREWLLPSRTMKPNVWPPLLGLAYIGLIAMLGGFRGDHVLLGLLPLLDAYNENTRRFFRAFIPMIGTGAIFDFMRYFYWQGISGRVHVIEPYQLDRRWLGIGGLTWNEWFAAHHWPVLDLLCGVAYLVFVGEYLVLAFWLFFRRRTDMLRVMTYGFLLVNLLGYLTYFIYPAAPPWYVAKYGFGPARMDIHNDPAGVTRLDALLGTHLANQWYGRGVDVYGAIPSLHVSYPFIAVWATLREPVLRRARVPVIAFFFLMCLSAVYLQHHYVIDVILGVVYAGATLALLRVPAWLAHRSAARASFAQPSASGSCPDGGDVERRSASE